MENLSIFYHVRIEMVYIVAASSLYHSLEQLGNPEKEQFLPKIFDIPGLSLNPNTTNPQKNLGSLLSRVPLAKKTSRGCVARHHQSFYHQPPHKQLQSLLCRGIDRNPENIDKYRCNCILSEKRYTGYQEPADQHGYSCHS